MTTFFSFFTIYICIPKQRSCNLFRLHFCFQKYIKHFPVVLCLQRICQYYFALDKKGRKPSFADFFPSSAGKGKHTEFSFALKLYSVCSRCSTACIACEMLIGRPPDWDFTLAKKLEIYPIKLKFYLEENCTSELSKQSDPHYWILLDCWAP